MLSRPASLLCPFCCHQRNHTHSHDPHKRAATLSYCDVVQVFPHNRTLRPGLLARLERGITAGTHAVARSAATASTSCQPPELHPAQLQSVYASALSTFAEGFPSYAPLLRQIQGEMDSAIEAATACALDGVALKQQLWDAQQEREAAVAHAYRQVRLPPSLLTGYTAAVAQVHRQVRHLLHRTSLILCWRLSRRRRPLHVSVQPRSLLSTGCVRASSRVPDKALELCSVGSVSYTHLTLPTKA